MFNICLYEPQIPPNTGNIIRLCANTGATLHLIHPLGFSMSEKNMRRAGLDYHLLSSVHEHADFASFRQKLNPRRIYAVSTKGKTQYCKIKYKPEDVLLFGSETRGLPDKIRNANFIEDVITIPMQKKSRSLNLANSVSIILYEAWRQHNFMLG